jgi:hypothetical protein
MADEPCTKQPAAANTEFAESPDTLAWNDDTSETSLNLPAAAKTIYAWTGGEAAVTVVPQNHGSVVFLAWDWYGVYGEPDDGPVEELEASAIPVEGFDLGWFTVLLAATDATVGVNDAAVDEGATATFTISLPGGPVSQDVVVNYATEDGTAVAGTDYTSVSGTAVIPSGSSSVTVDVPTLVRAGAQGARSFDLDIDAPYWAQVADPTGVGTITDPPAPSTTTTAPVRPAAQAVVATPRFTG